jgi:hypothetical protein
LVHLTQAHQMLLQKIPFRQMQPMQPKNPRQQQLDKK